MDIIEVRETEVFSRWMTGLRDPEARTRILVRIRRLTLGNFGDVKSVGGGISELRVDYGPGYRVYFANRGKCVIVLLIGGDKRTQDRDVRKAQSLLKTLED